MKNKKLLIGLVALAAAVVLLAGIWFAAKPETASGAKAYQVSVVHKDGSVVDFAFCTDEEYLGAALLAEGLIEGEEGPYGLMISAVDGETADWNVDSSYWALYIGDEYATTGVDTTPVYDGSEFTLEYTIG